MVIIALILEDKKSSKEFYEKSILDLKSKNDLLKSSLDNLQNKVELNSAKTRDLNEDRLVDDIDINKAKSIVSRKDEDYGKHLTLEDFIIDSIERNGLKKTKEIFNGLVKIFELAGRDISNKEQIYNHYF